MTAIPQVRSFAAGEMELAAYLNTIRDACDFLTTPPFCVVSFTPAITIATSTSTGVAWNVETTDSTNMHSTASNLSRFTPTVPGWYVMTATIFWAADSRNYRQVNVIQNGTLTTDEDDRLSVGASGMASNFHSSPLFCNGTGDYLELKVWQNTTVNLVIGVGSVATCMWVSGP